MAVEELNRFIGQSWGLLSKQIVLEMQEGLRTSAMSAVFPVKHPLLSIDIAGAPGFDDVKQDPSAEFDEFTVAIPAGPKPWSVHLTGLLDGSLGPVKIQGKRLQLSIHRLRAVAYLKVRKRRADTDQPLEPPVLSTVGLSVDLDLEVKNLFRVRTPKPGGSTGDTWKVDAGGFTGTILTAEVLVDFEWFVNAPIKVKTTITLNLLEGKLSLRPIAKLPEVKFTVPIPDQLKDLLQLAASEGLPATWPTITVTEPPAPPIAAVDLVQAAAQAEAGLDAHIPGGTVVDTVFPPRQLDNKQITNVNKLVQRLKNNDPLPKHLRTVWLPKVVTALQAHAAGKPLPDLVLQALNAAIAGPRLPHDHLPGSVKTRLQPYLAETLRDGHLARLNRWILEASLPDCIQQSWGATAGFDEHFYGERDSAIWTGHLLAAEAFRYATTAGAEQQAAHQRVQQVLAGVERLFVVPAEHVKNACNSTLCRELLPLDVHVRQGLIARSVLAEADLHRAHPRYTSDRELLPKDKQDTYYDAGVSLDGQRWFAFGRHTDPPSRDQIIGVVLGLAATLKLVPPVHAKVVALIVALADQLLESGFNLVTPKGPLDAKAARVRGYLETSYFFQFHQQLAILRLAASAKPDKFEKTYQEAAAAVGPVAWVPVWIDTFDPLNFYYKFNLSQAALTVLALLEPEQSPHRRHYAKMARVLRTALGKHRNAYFNLCWALAHPQAERQGILQGADAYGTDTVAAETKRLLAELFGRFRKVPGPHGLPLNKNPFPDYLAKLPAAAMGSFQPIGAKPIPLIAQFALPVHVRPGSGLDFVWQRNPFGTGLKKLSEVGLEVDMPYIESPGVDFLLPYWMLRYIEAGN